MTDTPEMRERKASAFDKLRKLCGYVENGSDTSVKIGQDDATRDWIIHVGKKDWWHGQSLLQAVEAAELKED